MTTTSRERREAVKAAIVHYHPHPIKNPLIFQEDIDAWHDAWVEDIIAAALPDRAAFTGLLDDLVCSATEYGNATPNSEREARAAYEASEARDALITLVYGADDAQAGEVE